MADFVTTSGLGVFDMDKCLQTAYASPLYMEQLAKQGKTPEQSCQEQAIKLGEKTQEELEREAFARESAAAAPALAPRELMMKRFAAKAAFVVEPAYEEEQPPPSVDEDDDLLPKKPMPMWPLILGALGLAGGGYYVWKKRGG